MPKSMRGRGGRVVFFAVYWSTLSVIVIKPLKLVLSKRVIFVFQERYFEKDLSS